MEMHWMIFLAGISYIVCGSIWACRGCQKEQAVLKQAEQDAKDATKRICLKCNTYKDRSAFVKARFCKGGQQCWCKPCQRKHQLEDLPVRCPKCGIFKDRFAFGKDKFTRCYGGYFWCRSCMGKHWFEFGNH